MKKIIIITILLIPAIVFSGFSNSELKTVANTVNKMAPKMVDRETRLDRVIGFNNTLTYIYTLINYHSNQLNPAKFKANLKPILIKQACSASAMKIFFQKGTVINYSYFSKDNQFIVNVSISPATCGY